MRLGLRIWLWSRLCRWYVALLSEVVEAFFDQIIECFLERVNEESAKEVTAKADLVLCDIDSSGILERKSDLLGGYCVDIGSGEDGVYPRDEGAALLVGDLQVQS